MARVLTVAAFALILAVLLLRAYPFPATIDSLSCAISVAEFRPGFLDGKPTYAFLGQIPRSVNAAMGGNRADLMRWLSFWCALFAWGMLVLSYLLARDLYSGSRTRGWAVVGLIASSPIFLFMAAIVEKYTVTLALLLLSVLLWIRRRYAGWGIAWGLAIGAHITSVLLVVPCAVSLILDPSRRADRRRAIAGTVLAGAVSVPLYLWVLSYAQGIGVFFGYLTDLVFHEYAFMKALRPDRLLASALSDPIRGGAAVLGVLAFAATLVVLVRARARISRGLSRGIAAWIAVAIAAGVVAWAYSKNLRPFCALAGIPLLALGAVSVALHVIDRIRDLDEPDPRRGPSPAIATFVLPWCVTNLLFFVAWDHFYGQFSIYIVPPLALLAAGIGAEGWWSGPSPSGIASRPGGHRRWDVILVGAAVVGGLLLSRDVVGRTRWKMTLENDERARAIASAIPKGSLVIAGWDGVNLAYHAPGIEALSIVSGEESRSIVWKEKRRHTDLVGEASEAIREGRRVFVTQRWLDQPGDENLERSREALKREFGFNPKGRGLLELTPRSDSMRPSGPASARMDAHDG